MGVKKHGKMAVWLVGKHDKLSYFSQKHDKMAVFQPENMTKRQLSTLARFLQGRQTAKMAGWLFGWQAA